MHSHTPLFSDLLPQQVEPPLQPSTANPLPLTQISALPLQLDVLPLQPLAVCAHPHPLSVFLQWRGKPPLLPSTLRAYVPLLSTLLLC